MHKYIIQLINCIAILFTREIQIDYVLKAFAISKKLKHKLQVKEIQEINKKNATLGY